MAAQAIAYESEEWTFFEKVTDVMYVLVNDIGVRGEITFETTEINQITQITDIYLNFYSKEWGTWKVTEFVSPPSLVVDAFIVEGHILERKKIRITNPLNKPGFAGFIKALMQCEKNIIAPEREYRGTVGAWGAGGAGDEKTAMLQIGLRF